MFRAFSSIARAAPRVAAMRSLHASVIRPSTNGLIGALDKEIAIEQTDGTPPVFPSEVLGFQFSYTPGNPIFSLTNTTSSNEQITLRVNINDCDIPEPPLEDGDDDEMLPPQPVFTIHVANNNKGKTLIFNAILEDSDLIVTRMGVKDSPVAVMDEPEHAYLTEFQFLDDGLQEAAISYLAEKGVGQELLDEVSGLVADVEYNEYLHFLGDVKNFLE